MSDRMSDDDWNNLGPELVNNAVHYKPFDLVAKLFEECRRARTREAELERKVEGLELQARTLRETGRNQALVDDIERFRVAASEAEAKSSALEREVERLRTTLETVETCEGNSFCERCGDATRSALSPPKDKLKK